MRVIAGLFRGRSLVSPPGQTTRPITDRVKESLFNILGHRCATPGALPDIDVLDVFCGPGSLGIEALSRGAQACVFVERDRAALRALRENLSRLDLTRRSRVLADNAWTMRPPFSPRGFGLIFVDPPYREAEDVLRVADLLTRLAPGCQQPGGLIVFRHELHTVFQPESLPTLQGVDERTFGRMRLVFLERKEGQHEQGTLDNAQ